jgi:hypothetical protein
MIQKPPRTAQPGDIFLLLLPTSEDLDLLTQEQHRLNTQFGGQLVKPIHITLQRFSPHNSQHPEDCVNTLRKRILAIQSFEVEADALIQFFAPYWQNYVLRWRVKETAAWSSFRDRVKTTLDEINCPSHFHRQRHATCTILKLPGKVDLRSPSPEISMPLFNVREVVISTLKESGNFEVIEKLKLKE